MPRSLRSQVPGTAMRPLSYGYLAWHCVTMTVLVALLARATLAYAGLLGSEGALAPVVEVFGAEVSVWALISLGWVMTVLVTLAGIAFALCVLVLPRHPTLLGRAVVLGRVMFGLCLGDLVFAIVQGNPVVILSAVISGALTGLLALEVRKFERTCSEHPSETVGSVPDPSFVVKAVEHAAEHETDFGDAARPLFKSVSGYATIMLVWGSLRVVSGLAVLFSRGTLTEGAGGLVARICVGAAVIASGAYLIMVGRFGKMALVGGANLRTFLVMSAVGLGFAVCLLGVYLLWGTWGWSAATQDLFSAVLDVLLYGSGCIWGLRLAKAASR